MRKIKKGDEIIVIAGKDKGKTGAVISVNVESSKVIVAGINMVKKHVKPNPQAGIEGGIIPKEKALAISNVAIYNPVSKKADGVSFKTLDSGKKVRVFKSNKESIDV
ncbi:MAG: 50S ribosomal protein L24 [Gammaproteobacteria bacterium]|nr:50S ribosomal protein L24 [Gammaproteobacteria bacterium]